MGWWNLLTPQDSFRYILGQMIPHHILTKNNGFEAKLSFWWRIPLVLLTSKVIDDYGHDDDYGDDDDEEMGGSGCIPVARLQLESYSHGRLSQVRPAPDHHQQT